MKKKIAVVAGGDSSEFEVSIRSAQNIYSLLNKDLFEVFNVEIQGLKWEAVMSDGRRIPVSREDFSVTIDGEHMKFDYAYITIHGTPGENGILQGYFDLLHMPYSCCGVFAAALTFDKYACNHYLERHGVRIADSLLLRKGQHIETETVIANIGLPCFIKPNTGGSSFGVTKVKIAADIQPAIEKARTESDDIIIEQMSEGTEVSCGIYRANGNLIALPVTEVVPKNEFFDYDAKYNGMVEEITPARIPDEQRNRIHALNRAIYEIVDARGIIRIDYIIGKNGEITLLEVNTTPGMTDTSFIPQQVRAAGMSMSEVLTDVINETI